jgi:small conductance mechanosensitive channel
MSANTPAEEASKPILPDLSAIDLEKLKSVDGVVEEISLLNSELMPLAITLGGRVVAAVAILIVSWMVGNWIRNRFMKMRRLDSTLKDFLGSFFKYIVVAVGAITVIGLFGIPMASLLAVLGAAGLAIGLALQGTLANVASGVMLLILRPFNVGDYITWGAEGGTVKSLGLFGTELAMPDNVYIFAPNSKIWGNEIRNYSRNMLRRQDIMAGISYGDDINKAFEIIYKVLNDDDRILKEPEDKKPQVMVDAMADFSINLIVRFWSNNSEYWNLRWDITKTIKESLEDAGITIPFPTRTVEFVDSTSNGVDPETKKKIAAGAA